MVIVATMTKAIINIIIIIIIMYLEKQIYFLLSKKVDEMLNTIFEVILCELNCAANLNGCELKQMITVLVPVPCTGTGTKYLS